MSRMMGRSIRAALVLAALLLAPLRAEATTWEVRSEATAHAYRFFDAERRPVERMRFGETLFLAARTPLSTKGGLVLTRALLRFQGDTGLSERDAELQESFQPTRFDMLTASASGYGLASGLLDFEIGRSVRLDSLGFAMLDGVSVDLHTPWYVGLGLHGGSEPADTRDALTWNPYRLDGVKDLEEDPTVFMVGASIFSTGLGLHSIRVDARQWRDTEKNVRAFQVGAAVRLAFPETLFTDLDARYDILGRQLADLRGRVAVPVSRAVEVEARYVRSVPVFDSASIWSVFTVFPMQEAAAGVRLRVGPEILVNARGSVRVVEDDREADTEPGAHLSLAWRPGRRVVLVSWDHYDGSTGSWDLFWLEGGSPVLVRDLHLRGALTMLFVADPVAPGFEHEAYGAQLGLSYRMSRGWEVRLTVEDQDAFSEDHALRGLLVLHAALGSEGE
jgi:hypothetical protein